jgi:hypothetical protein
MEKMVEYRISDVESKAAIVEHLENDRVTALGSLEDDIRLATMQGEW